MLSRKFEAAILFRISSARWHHLILINWAKIFINLFLHQKENFRALDIKKLKKNRYMYLWITPMFTCLVGCFQPYIAIFWGCGGGVIHLELRFSPKCSVLGQPLYKCLHRQIIYQCRSTQFDLLMWQLPKEVSYHYPPSPAKSNIFVHINKCITSQFTKLQFISQMCKSMPTNYFFTCHITR